MRYGKREIVDIIKGLLFPELPGCPLCGRQGSPRHLCRACLELWAELGQGMMICEKCGRFCPGLERDFCYECEQVLPPYLIARGVAPYIGPVREALHQFKFFGRMDLAGPFGELMAALVTEVFPARSLDLVVPVPLHVKREQERGFNQAALLAKAVAAGLSLPVLPEALVRIRETPGQTALSRQDRRANLREAFAPGPDSPALTGKNILLVDDVYTTGSTALECCQTLLAAGVLSVCVVTLATGIEKRPVRSN